MTTIRFETTTCDRCGGTGYMPYAAYGGVCFKCNKAGKVLTRKGLAARKAFYAARVAACQSVPVGELQVGQKISQDGETWRTVVAPVDLEETSGYETDANGERFPFVRVETQKTSMLVRADATVLVWSPEAQKAAFARVAKMSGAIIS